MAGKELDTNLQLPGDEGGLVLPILKTYYQAAQIKPLVNICICNPDYSAICKSIECQDSVKVPLQAIIDDSDLKHHLGD